MLHMKAVALVLAAVLGLSGPIYGTRPAAAQGQASDPMIAAPPGGGVGLVETGTKHASGRAVTVYVFGDALGNGVWEGLKQAFPGDNAVQLLNRSKVSTGLVRDDYYDWSAELATILEKEEMDIAVVMIGSNDRQRLRHEGGDHEFGSTEFRSIYAGRVEAFMQQFRRRGIAVYWLGLPAMRAKGYSTAMASLNEIFRAGAEANGVTFVPTREAFSGPDREFSTHGPDISGTVRRLRAGDGVHFTRRGYRKLAALVEPGIREFLATGPVVKGERVFVASPQPEEGAGTASLLPAGQRQEADRDVPVSAARTRAVFQATSPAYKVLTLGERIEPRPGRGDDFSWSR